MALPMLSCAHTGSVKQQRQPAEWQSSVEATQPAHLPPKWA